MFWRCQNGLLPVVVYDTKVALVWIQHSFKHSLVSLHSVQVCCKSQSVTVELVFQPFSIRRLNNNLIIFYERTHTHTRKSHQNVCSATKLHTLNVLTYTQSRMVRQTRKKSLKCTFCVCVVRTEFVWLDVVGRFCSSLQRWLCTVRLSNGKKNRFEVEAKKTWKSCVCVSVCSICAESARETRAQLETSANKHILSACSFLCVCAVFLRFAFSRLQFFVEFREKDVCSAAHVGVLLTFVCAARTVSLLTVQHCLPEYCVCVCG